MQLCNSLSILWHCLSLGLEWKLTFSSPVVMLSFPDLLAYWVQHFHSIIFQCPIFLPFHTVHEVLKARYWSGLPFPSPVHHILPDVQAGFRKGRGTRDQIAQHLLDHGKSKSSRKTSISALVTMSKPLTVWITINWKILRDRNTRPPDLPLEKSVCSSGSNS